MNVRAGFRLLHPRHGGLAQSVKTEELQALHGNKTHVSPVPCGNYGAARDLLLFAGRHVYLPVIKRLMCARLNMASYLTRTFCKTSLLFVFNSP